MGRYEIVRAVASGGMGTVWLARAQTVHGLAKTVAVKTIRADLAESAEARALFLDEARVAMRLDHIHVAQVFDAGEHDGVPYLVLEWIDGASLERVCGALAARGARMPVGELLRIASDACEGLEAAHALRDEAGRPLGLVHRDVSPQNILISRAGVAKVIDFGIAKARDRLAGETEAGIVRGKLAYMAPEHAAGLAVDRRSDVWAMGATIFRALAGTPPGATGELPADVPAPVRDVVARALASEPGDRYPTAGELQRAIEDAMVASGLRATRADVVAQLGEVLAPSFADTAPGALAPTVPSPRDLEAPPTAATVAQRPPRVARDATAGAPRAMPAQRARRASRATSAVWVVALALVVGAVVAWQRRAGPVPAAPELASAGSDAGVAVASAPAAAVAPAAGSGSAAPSSPPPPPPPRHAAAPAHAAATTPHVFAPDDPVSYFVQGAWHDAIVAGVDRDGRIAIRVLGVASPARDVPPDGLRPRVRLPALAVGTRVQLGKLSCTIADSPTLEEYWLACPFGNRVHAYRSDLRPAS